MRVKVVGASAIAALLFGEPDAEAIAGRLGAARLAAPALLGFELANVCLIEARRHPEQRAMLVAAFRPSTASRSMRLPRNTTPHWNSRWQPV